MVKGHHHEGRLTPYHEGDCPSWWGEAPLLKYLTKILIFGHYLTPQKRENSPQAIINQNNLIDTEKPYKLKISCGQSL